MSDLIQEAPVQDPVAAPKAKQYLIMADELHMAMLGKIIPGLLFVQVEGMAMQNNDQHMLLVNPIVKPPAPETVQVPTAIVPEAV